ncbi:MAG: hypothetical protein KME17_04500 [Cyanosarcina radialis HA8281-LM2]|jgi:hypothetical protein|nr:hypothetical protein [Cyanosarcina radialis HA8281-LM2]
MNVDNCKNSLLKLVGFLGVIGTSALFFLPGLVRANSDLSENTSVAQTTPGTLETSPTPFISPTPLTTPGTLETSPTPFPSPTPLTTPGTLETSPTPFPSPTTTYTPGTGGTVDDGSGSGQTPSSPVRGLW